MNADQVTKVFDARVKHACRNIKQHARGDIIRGILNHERKKLCIDRACEQVRIYFLRPNATMAKAEMLVHVAADTFCNVALEHMQQQAISQAERQRRIDEANRIANIEQEFEAEQKDLTDTRIRSYPGAAAKSGIILP